MFTLTENWRGEIGTYAELADAQQAANAHAGSVQKWKYNAKTQTWASAAYTIRFKDETVSTLAVR